jgi:uridine phosphorylase
MSHIFYADALVNIDLESRTAKQELTQLTLIRVGTSGGLQPFLPVGSYCISEYSIGLDTVLNYYNGFEQDANVALSSAFIRHVDWDMRCGQPYAANADPELLSRFFDNEIFDEKLQDSNSSNTKIASNAPGLTLCHRGITVSAVGFYGPQGRELRIPLARPNLNEKIENFDYEGLKITNYEMESSALAGLAKLLGHKAMTVCCIIANRLTKDVTPNHGTAIDDLILLVLEKL